MGVLVVGCSFAAAQESPNDCINVQEPGYAGGDRQCFPSDEVGMVCGWDADPNEAFCELTEAGVIAAPTDSVSKEEVVDKGAGENASPEVPEECVNVEGLKISKGTGTNTCRQKDKVGLVCFGDKNPTHEAYCELSKDGVKVCARSSNGGRCKEGTHPATNKKQKLDEKRKKKAQEL